MKNYFRVKRFPWLFKLWGWCLQYPLKQQAIETLREEGLTWERFSLTTTNGTMFAIGECEGESNPSNGKKWINKIHKFIGKICLERIKETPNITSVEVVYELVV